MRLRSILYLSLCLPVMSASWACADTIDHFVLTFNNESPVQTPFGAVTVLSWDVIEPEQVLGYTFAPDIPIIPIFLNCSAGAYCSQPTQMDPSIAGGRPYGRGIFGFDGWGLNWIGTDGLSYQIDEFGPLFFSGYDSVTDTGSQDFHAGRYTMDVGDIGIYPLKPMPGFDGINTNTTGDTLTVTKEYVSPVPEPSSLFLLTTGVLLGCRRYWRK
jgi:hypothetical protein